MRNKDYEKIIPTAWLTAYPRVFSNIPYSKEIFDCLEQSIGDIPKNLKVPKLAPELEARYKLVNKLLAKEGTKQVLELAVGLSPRGIIMARDPSITYVELDLPKMMREKRKIMKKLNLKPMPNLFLEEGNALDSKSISKAISHFKNKPIAVINEGLLRYLNFGEKEIVVKNIRNVLKEFGGVWITPDITLKKFLETQDITMPGKNKIIMKMTGKNYASENKFEDLSHAKRFFESFGFSVEQHNFLEVQSELTSPKTLGLSQEEVKDLIKSASVFVMRLKTT